MKCIRCQADLPEEARTCAACGVAVRAASPEETREVLRGLRDQLGSLRGSLRTVSASPSDPRIPVDPVLFQGVGAPAEGRLPQTPRSLDHRITVLQGLHAGQSFDIGRIITFGRDESCEVQLTDIAVSREHCRIVYHPERKKFVVQDLGSENGTSLNGERVHRRELGLGDRIQIGRAELLFHTGTIEELAEEDVLALAVVAEPEARGEPSSADTPSAQDLDEDRAGDQESLPIEELDASTPGPPTVDSAAGLPNGESAGWDPLLPGVALDPTEGQTILDPVECAISMGGQGAQAREVQAAEEQEADASLASLVFPPGQIDPLSRPDSPAGQAVAPDLAGGVLFSGVDGALSQPAAREIHVPGTLLVFMAVFSGGVAAALGWLLGGVN